MATEPKEQLIYRAPHGLNDQYLIVSRETAQDVSLSYEALGLLNYLLSKPSGWVVVPSALTREKCGRDKVYSILNELVERRHIVRERQTNPDGTVAKWKYTVHDLPVPLPENPDLANPDQENPDSINNRRLEKRDSINNTSPANAGNADPLNEDCEDSVRDIQSNHGANPQSGNHEPTKRKVPVKKKVVAPSVGDTTTAAIVAPKPPQPHMLPVCHFILGARGGALGKPLYTECLNIGALSRISREYLVSLRERYASETNYEPTGVQFDFWLNRALERYQSAGALYASYCEAERPTLTWSVAETRTAITYCLALVDKHITPISLQAFIASERRSKWRQENPQFIISLKTIADRIDNPNQNGGNNNGQKPMGNGISGIQGQPKGNDPTGTAGNTPSSSEIAAGISAKSRARLIQKQNEKFAEVQRMRGNGVGDKKRTP